MKNSIGFITIALFLLVSKDIVAQDIAGIKIGDSFSAQKSLITKANSDYQLTDITLTDGSTIGIKAIAQKNGKATDYMLMLHNSSDIVWFIGRAQVFEKGSRINPDTLYSSLKEKYGSFSDASSDPAWYFDRQGKLLPESAAIAPCIMLGLPTQPFANLRGATISVPNSFSPKCGVIINTHIVKDRTDDMVSEFSVEIIDNKRMFDELKAKNTNIENERKTQLEKEKTNNNKPKL